MLLTRPSKNVYRQHRSEAGVTAPHRFGPLSADTVEKLFLRSRDEILIREMSALRNNGSH
jgi:hypothetical protein